MPTRPKVLICDDDPLVVRSLAREARVAGWITLAETSASRVLLLALKHRPELIVLDVHQLIDGRHLLVELRADPRTSTCRVVMVSGSLDPDLERQCLALGADAFARKPFDLGLLLEAPPLNVAADEPAPCMILIADDSPQMVAALARAARREGFEPITDTTSTQVLSLARAHHPGVIVLDVHQAIDGRDLLAQLKADPVTRDIKVVMLSGEEDQLVRHDCLKLGAEDYFTKPLDPLFFRRVQRIAGLPVTH